MAKKLTTRQAVGLSLFGAGATTISELFLADAERKLFKVNERISKLRAEDARKRGQEAVSRKIQKGKQAIGEARVTFAASGIRVDVGSAKAIQEEAKEVTELDVTTIRINALREAMGFETDALIASGRGELTQSRRRLSAIDTLLSGGIRAANYYFGDQ